MVALLMVAEKLRHPEGQSVIQGRLLIPSQFTMLLQRTFMQAMILQFPIPLSLDPYSLLHTIQFRSVMLVRQQGFLAPLFFNSALMSLAQNFQQPSFSSLESM
jgi:hypothetical protein